MAQFRGKVQGNRGEASRLGSKDSGLSATAEGWCVGGRISIGHYETGDTVFLSLSKGSRSMGSDVVCKATRTTDREQSETGAGFAVFFDRRVLRAILEQVEAAGGLEAFEDEGLPVYLH